jgi:hypothetical protein
MTTNATEPAPTRDLHVRSIPAELRRDIKIAATAADMTIKDWVIEAIKAKMELGKYVEEVKAGIEAED